MKINRDMVGDDSSDYYKESFRHTLESHMPYLRSAQTTTTIPVSTFNTEVYDKDLFGFLTSVRIKPCYHWVVMRVNDMFSPFDFVSGITTLLIPSTKELESLRQSWNTTNIVKN